MPPPAEQEPVARRPNTSVVLLGLIPLRALAVGSYEAKQNRKATRLPVCPSPARGSGSRVRVTPSTVESVLPRLCRRKRSSNGYETARRHFLVHEQRGVVSPSCGRC